MTYAIERAIDQLERRGERRGKIEGKLETAMAMLDDGLPFETASKCAGSPVDELKRSGDHIRLH
jgi:hypothetical protein